MVTVSQQVIALADAVQTECRRVALWLVAALVLALAASLLAAATKSIVLVVVAAFAWFFAWNRWMLRRFLSAFLPPPTEKVEAWLEDATKGLQHPPAWYRCSEYIALLTFFLLAALVTIIVVSTSGIWMRLLYAALWAISVALIVLKVRNARHNRSQNELER